MTFKALLATRPDKGVNVSLTDLELSDLMPGEVTLRVDYSTINYKDGLALTGAAPIIETFPLIGGIDLSGTVEASESADFVPGDRVVLNGYGLSQTFHGGYAQMARVPAKWLVKLPSSLSNRDAMAIGTAGYTAMLAILALEHGGLSPTSGDVLVTGANGGVGSVAIAILSGLGYRVIASTGRPQEADYLKALGAAEIIDRASLSAPGRPMGAERWAGVVDSVGSHTLVNAMAQTAYRGVVAACGLAQGADLPGTVLPFILRNITLAGIDSVQAPMSVRLLAWERLGRDLDLGKLASTVTEVGLAEVPGLAADILQGKIRGRTVVDVNR